jgi:hypothetical protein
MAPILSPPLMTAAGALGMRTIMFETRADKPARDTFFGLRAWPKNVARFCSPRSALYRHSRSPFCLAAVDTLRPARIHPTTQRRPSPDAPVCQGNSKASRLKSSEFAVCIHSDRVFGTLALIRIISRDPCVPNPWPSKLGLACPTGVWSAGSAGRECACPWR